MEGRVQCVLRPEGLPDVGRAIGQHATDGVEIRQRQQGFDHRRPELVRDAAGGQEQNALSDRREGGGHASERGVLRRGALTSIAT